MFDDARGCPGHHGATLSTLSTLSTLPRDIQRGKGGVIAMPCSVHGGRATPATAGYVGGATVQPAVFDTAESPKIGKPLVLAFGYHRHVWLLAMFSQSRSFKNRLQGSHGILD